MSHVERRNGPKSSGAPTPPAVHTKRFQSSAGTRGSTCPCRAHATTMTDCETRALTRNPIAALIQFGLAVIRVRAADCRWGPTTPAVEIPGVAAARRALARVGHAGAAGYPILCGGPAEKYGGSLHERVQGRKFYSAGCFYTRDVSFGAAWPPLALLPGRRLGELGNGFPGRSRARVLLPSRLAGLLSHLHAACRCATPHRLVRRRLQTLPCVAT